MTLIDVVLWLTDATLQFMARDAHAIALNAFAQAHTPLNFPALAPAAVPLALPFALPINPAPDLTADDDVDRVIIIYPSVMPFAFNQFLTPDNSVRRWLTSALPLVPSLTLVDNSVVAEVPVRPSVVEVAPVTTAVPPVPKSRKTKKDNIAETTDAAKTTRKRSPKTKKTATAG